MIIPVASFAFAVFGLPERLITSSIAIAAVLALVIEFGLSFSGTFDKAISRTASSFAVIMYPGYLVMYLAIMTVWHDAGTILSLFFLMVFGCDSIAWLFGVLLGKNNRGLVPASPKKSIAGFIGAANAFFVIGDEIVTSALNGSILPGIAFYVYFPAVFGGSLWKILLLGVMTAAASIVGDIIESVLKRSAGVKDSGSIIPGRGGVLDSIDSILLAAPVFYILCDFLYGFGA